MKKLGIAIALIATMTFASCAAGPHQLRRTVDDWDQKLYVDNPWLNGVLWFVPVIPLVSFGASLGDFFIGDMYSFWFKDAWDGKGTGFNHFDVQHTDGAMNSMLMDDGKFLEVK
jgi:hypothetical protein